MVKALLILLFIPSLCFGANYYVDSTYDGSKGSSNGSFSRPWTTISQVNKHSFRTGDNLYFRAGTRILMTDRLVVNWSGTESNRVIIGSYYGENNFGLGGAPRPILDGRSNTVPTQGSYRGLIDSRNHAGYVTIQDLEVRDSGGAGIRIGNDHNVTNFINTHSVIRNCVIYRSWRRGIEVARASHNLIENNILSETSYGNGKSSLRIMGAAIEITAMAMDWTTNHNIIRGNTINRGVEGIGLYKEARFNIVENNTVYDCGTYNIYLDRSRENIIRNNIVYATQNSRWGPNQGGGIVFASETHTTPNEVPIGWHQVYGNMIAGLGSGIRIGIADSATIGHKGMRIFNNRIVDTNANYHFRRDNEGDWNDNQIYQNYSFILTSGNVHLSNMSPVSFSWNQNIFNNPPSVTGNASRNADFNTVKLKKTSGWRDLKPGTVDESYFLFTGETLSENIIERDEPSATPDKVSNFRIQ